MDRIIEVKVSGGYLSLDGRKAGNQHEANATRLRITFDPSWDGYAKTVTFWNANGMHQVKRILTADRLEDPSKNARVYLCPIPGEAMTESGLMTFTIDGYVNGVRQRTAGANLGVDRSPYTENAADPADPTPSQAEQLQVQIENLLGDVKAETLQAEIARAAAELAQLGAEQARSDALAIIEGQIVPEITLKDKADLVNGKVPNEQLPSFVSWDNDVLGAVDVLDWAKAQSVPTTTAATPQTLNMPYADYWTVELKVSALGAWRRLIARLASTSRTDIRERYFINGEWGQWEQIAVTNNAVSKTTMTGKLRIKTPTYPSVFLEQTTLNREGGIEVTKAGSVSAYTRAYGSEDNRSVLLLHSEEVSLESLLQVMRVVNGSAETYNVLHTGNLQLLNNLGMRIQSGSYMGNGVYGSDSPNSIQNGRHSGCWYEWCDILRDVD